MSNNTVPPQRITSSTAESTVIAAYSPASSLSELATRIGQASELMEAGRMVAKRRDNILGLLLRALSREEIAVMEDHGCHADDWTRIQVAQDFDPFRIRRTQLRGSCVLGRWSGEVEMIPGVRLARGIYDCTLVDCQVGNDCLLENVRFAVNVVCDHEAVLFDVGIISCSGATSFGCGHRIPLACETGGRDLPVWAEVMIDDAAFIAGKRSDQAGQRAILEAVSRYAQAVKSPVTWVRSKARVRHVKRVHDAYIGHYAEIMNAIEVSNIALLSSAEEPSCIDGGAHVSDSVLQQGVHVSGMAIVKHSVLCEHSAVDEHATVETSIIGPNTAISKGEVTASLIGPFVGFHHQSMLIAVFWPEGKGNVAHGAMVGSNHTGRAPDQEFWPGEGLFLGLGCAVRYPADFSEAPYSFVSMGVSTLPQKMRYPFSLIAVPAEPLGALGEHVPRAYNEITPGWSLSSNAYGLVRMELKFAARDKARRHRFDYKVHRPHTMRLVKEARERLMNVSSIKAVYIDDDLPGLGKNFLRESVRLQAIDTYTKALKRYCLRMLLAEQEKSLHIPGSAELAHELEDLLIPHGDLSARMKLLIDIERANAEQVQRSKLSDDERGNRIIPGYADAHAPADQDAVVRSAWERVRKTEERIAHLGIR